MNSQLTTEEIFKLLQDRFNIFNFSGFSSEGLPYDIEAHNAVIATLRDAVESFTMGRLQVTTKAQHRYTEEDINNAVLAVLASSDHGPIEYSHEGIEFLLKEVKKLLPDPQATITCQSIDEMTVQDRIERKVPKFYVSY